MNQVIHFFTSPGGIVAAIAVLLGMVAAFVAGPVAVVQRHRDKQARRPDVQISQVEVSELSPWSSSCELQFVLANARGGVGVLKALRLSVLECGSITEARPVYLGASNPVRQHRVELKPGVNLYDIRARMFSVEQPPLHFPAGDIQSLLVKIVAPPGNWYRVEIDAEWYDVQRPNDSILARSDAILLSFPLEDFKDTPPSTTQGRSF